MHRPPPVGVDPQPLVPGGPGRFGGDDVVLGHAVEHVALPRPGRVRVAQGRVVARRLRQPGEQGDLAQVQVAGVLVEVGAGRGLHPVGALAQVDLVQVEVEDLLLGEHALDAVGENRLGQLAQVALFRGEQQAAGDLLGDGRAALAAAAGEQVVDGGPGDGPAVQAGVLPETAVLGGDKGPGQECGHLAVGDDDAELVGDGVDGPAAAVEHQGGHLRPVVGHGADVGQAEEPGEHRADAHRDHAGDDEQQGDERPLVEHPAGCPGVVHLGGNVRFFQGQGGQGWAETVVLKAVSGRRARGRRRPAADGPATAQATLPWFPGFSIPKQKHPPFRTLVPNTHSL